VGTAGQRDCAADGSRRDNAVVAKNRQGLDPGPLQLVAVVGAGIWSVGLIIAGLTVPVYESESSGPAGSIVHGRDTLVSENGTRVLIVLAVPLMVTVLVGFAVLVSRKPWALRVASALVGVLLILNLLAMLTIGIFAVPVTAALVLACLCGFVRERAPEPPPMTTS